MDFLTIAPVRRQSPLPLHVQIRQYLLELIEAHADLLGRKRQLPTEQELARRLGVSLAPIRQAIHDLVKDGYLYRVQGRGTFVREQKVEVEMAPLLTSFTESMRASGLEPALHVLRQELVAAPADVRSKLRTKQRRLILIERLATVNREPVAILAAYLAPKAFPAILSTPLEGRSLYRTLKERYGVAPTWGESFIEVTRARRRESTLLGIPESSPLLKVDTTAYDDRDRPFEYSSVIYQADGFRLKLDTFRRDDRVLNIRSIRDRALTPADASEDEKGGRQHDNS